MWFIHWEKFNYLFKRVEKEIIFRFYLFRKSELDDSIQHGYGFPLDKISWSVSDYLNVTCIEYGLCWCLTMSSPVCNHWTYYVLSVYWPTLFIKKWMWWTQRNNFRLCTNYLSSDETVDFRPHKIIIESVIRGRQNDKLCTIKPSFYVICWWDVLLSCKVSVKYSYTSTIISL